MDVAVGTFIADQTAGCDIAITGVGFTPKFGIFMYGNSYIMSDTTGWGSNGWGFGLAGDTDDQACISQAAHHQLGAWGVNSTSGSLIRTLNGGGVYPPATFGNSQLGSWDTDGFTIYTSATHPYAAGPTVSYMVCGGTQILDVELVAQAPTSDIAGFGFDPNFMVSISHGSTNTSMAYSVQGDSDEGAGLVMHQYSKGTTGATLAGVSYGRIVANYPIAATYHETGWLAYGEMDGYITDGYQQNLVNGNIAVQYTLGVQFGDDASIPYYGTLTPSTDTAEQRVQLPKRAAGLVFMSHSQGAGGGGYAYTKTATSTDDLAGHYIAHGTTSTLGGTYTFNGVASTDANIAFVGSTTGITAYMVLNELNNTDFKWQMSAESTGITVHYWVLPGVYTSPPVGILTPGAGEITGKDIFFNVRGVMTFVSKLPKKIKNMTEGLITFSRSITRSVGILLWELAINIFSTDANFTQYNPKANISVAPGSSDSGPIIVDGLEVK